MSRTIALSASFLLTTALVLACGSTKSKTKKPATGAAAAKTTKKPATTPAPQKATAPAVAANKSSAAPTEEVCTDADEGRGACVDEFVVFCSAKTLYALDCATAFGGTCGDFDGAIGCVVEESE